MTNNIEFVKIPNRFGVEKRIAIKDLSEKQFQIQLFHCEKELTKKNEQLALLKSNNLKLNKIHTKEAVLQKEQNVKQMMYLEGICDFLCKLEFTLVNEYDTKFRVNEIVEFVNTEQHEMICN